jgi:hypothetical protein
MECLQPSFGGTLTVPTSTRRIRKRNVLVSTILWREGWPSEAECPLFAAKGPRYPMRHAVKKRLVKCQLLARLKQSQRSPMGRSRMYEDQMIPRVASRTRGGIDVDARNKTVERVVLCGAPNDRGHRR